MAKKRSFSDVFAKYKTYDDSKGRGSVNDWRSKFQERMGREQAETIVKDDNPLTIMGFTSLPTLAELKKQYRELMIKNHPDMGGDVKKCQKIIAAYTLLEERCTDE